MLIVERITFDKSLQTGNKSIGKSLPIGPVEARPEIVPPVQGALRIDNAGNTRDRVRPVRTDDKRIFEVQRNNGGGVDENGS